MKNSILLLFTVFFQISYAQEQTQLEVQNFPIPIFTNSNLSLVILSSAWEVQPQQGDELSVLDFNGLMVGSCVVLEGHNGLPIWGDNLSTSVKDGLSVGEYFRVLHWSKATDTYKVYSVFNVQSGGVTYLKDGFTIINSLGTPKDYNRDFSVYYHLKSVLSTQTKFSFYVPISGDYALRVYSAESTLYEIQETSFEKGYTSFDFPSEIPEGSYTVELTSGAKLLDSCVFNIN